MSGHEFTHAVKSFNALGFSPCALTMRAEIIASCSRPFKRFFSFGELTGAKDSAPMLGKITDYLNSVRAKPGFRTTIVSTLGMKK